ncbi:MAG: autotransporter domain-containing protein [Alphaproteobacteria bacterium]|nr:autotransporter domain-containing protein [Alphaproteobacteria bacterium]
MSHNILYAVSVLLALLVMPAMADVINLNDKYNNGQLKIVTVLNGNHSVLDVDDIKLGLSSVSDAVYVVNGNLDLIGNKIDLLGGRYDVIYASGGTVNITGDTISMVGGNKDPMGAVWIDQNGHINITGGEINIKNSGYGGIWVQNKTLGGNVSMDDRASLKITGDKINIDAPNAILAFSEGIVELDGDVSINGAERAIITRGGAQVIVNKSGVHSTKINGDIEFNYDQATSGTSVDATVDVVLSGADSYWTGNTVVGYDKKPADINKLNVNQATVTLTDGATWNATRITDFDGADGGAFYTGLNNLNVNGGNVNIADDARGITLDNADIKNGKFTGGHVGIENSASITDSVFANHYSAAQGGAIYNAQNATITLAGRNVFSGNRVGNNANDIYNNGTILISGGETTLGGGVLGEGTFEVSDGAVLNLGTGVVQQSEININGVVNADVISAREFGRLFGDVVFGDNAELNLNVACAGTYQIFTSDNNFDRINAGLLFDVTNNGADGVVITAKKSEQVVSEIGLSVPAASALVGLVNVGGPLADVSIAAQNALASGDIEYVEAETAKVAPVNKPVIHSVSTTVQNQVLSLVASRIAGGATGRSGGDFVTIGSGVWAHGLINRSKMNGAFHGDTRGAAFGVDATFNRKYMFGLGYAHGDTDVHAGGHKTDIKTDTLFAYAQYKPNQWFINGALNYTFADYTEHTDLFGVHMSSDYDVDSYGGQLALGYDFASGVTPSVGVRYLYITQDGYNNGIAHVEPADNNFLTGVAGLKYTFDIMATRSLMLHPELRAAATYDFVSDAVTATVLIPGAAGYIVNADRLSRLGGEFGMGLSVLYRGLTVSVNYDIDLHQNYTSQTGMLKLRYNF